MVGCYIKHPQYNKYLAIDENGKKWTKKEKAYMYCTEANALGVIKDIKRNIKYRNVQLSIVDRNDEELVVI